MANYYVRGPDGRQPLIWGALFILLIVMMWLFLAFTTLGSNLICTAGGPCRAPADISSTSRTPLVHY